MSEWKSTMLNTSAGCSGCPVCDFLDGDRSEAVLLEVIRRLDAALAAEEEKAEHWCRAYCDLLGDYTEEIEEI